jgi:hypothetical protein
MEMPWLGTHINVRQHCPKQYRNERRATKHRKNLQRNEATCMERTPMWHKQRVGFSGSSNFLSSTSCDQVLASLKGSWMTSSPGMETASNSAFSRTSMIWYRDLAPLFSISSNFCTFIRFTAADIARLVTGTVPRNTCRLQISAPSINVRCGVFEDACLDFGQSCASAERVTEHQ